VVIDSVARKYRAHDMPGGWILPNDGYGCGYTDLPYTVEELHKLGFWTGLWTENGVDRIAWEVGTAGTRLCKLDVAWVYRGYDFALDACRTAYEGIENNCDGRGFVWTVMGWAGTQRYATVWSGDQKGNWEYIRFHIPTVIGSGLSAFNAATGDVDGIFGGSPKTYVRDLQWKCFTPVLMGMSGWSKYMKQPYVYGEPYTTINRKYLKLKMRLTPYLYTYSHIAHTTGVPTVRGMVLEFPEDPVTPGKATQYQFMSGEWLLVAPVYTPSDERDSIYFPAGTWIDYWDGTRYEGNTWLASYHAPLDKLPLFVRSGAIIPMYQPMYYDWERPTDTLTLDIYPDGHSVYDLYEDDGLTREHRKGIYAFTRFEVSVANDHPNVAVITIYPAKGDFKGRLKKRTYLIRLHHPENGRIISASTGQVSTDTQTTIRVKMDL
jgi:alpha-glucosidase (family GH31 glycosyl hydrolase)